MMKNSSLHSSICDKSIWVSSSHIGTIYTKMKLEGMLSTALSIQETTLPNFQTTTQKVARCTFLVVLRCLVLLNSQVQSLIAGCPLMMLLGSFSYICCFIFLSALSFRIVYFIYYINLILIKETQVHSWPRVKQTFHVITCAHVHQCSSTVDRGGGYYQTGNCCLPPPLQVVDTFLSCFWRLTYYPFPSLKGVTKYAFCHRKFIGNLTEGGPSLCCSYCFLGNIVVLEGAYLNCCYVYVVEMRINSSSPQVVFQ